MNINDMFKKIELIKDNDIVKDMGIDKKIGDAIDEIKKIDPNKLYEKFEDKVDEAIQMVEESMDKIKDNDEIKNTISSIKKTIKKGVKEMTGELSSGNSIVKMVCANNGVIYMEEGRLGNYIMLPKDLDNNHKISLFIDDNNSSITLNKAELKNIIDGKITQNDMATKKQYLPDIFENDTDNIKEQPFQFVELKDYEDITDEEFNNFRSIRKASLISGGLWIGNGIRKIKLNFSDEIKTFLKSARNRAENEKYAIIKSAYFNKINNNQLDKNNFIHFDVKTINSSYVVMLNTDILQEYFKDNKGNSESNLFKGYIKISIKQDSLDDSRDNNVLYSFNFPFEIKMINPDHQDIEEDTDIVSIDFGTSSTCISHDNGRKMLSFNDNPQSSDDYENMTAIIMYNWQKVYRGWTQDNISLPHFNRSKNKIENIDIRNDHFDYSYKIKEELLDAPDTKTIDAIIAKMKFIPKYLEDGKRQKQSIKPFDNFKDELYLTDKVEEEDNQTLNPIALYGYLIGRSLNLQLRNKIYTQYHLTMPVSFNKYERKQLKDSLEYGLTRALPLPLRSKIQVEVEYEEPVALIGSIKKARMLTISQDKDAVLFAIFDFGGGTLDFAFGLYRKAVNDEDITVFDDEYDRYRNVIEIFNTSGEPIGGEILIEKLSWEIYKQNKDIMQQNQIPIFVPDHEEALQKYPADLFGNRHIDYMNLRAINERLSRSYLIDKKIDNFEVELYNVDQELQTITLDNIEKDDLDIMLKDIIEQSIKSFKDNLQNSFTRYLDRIKKFGYDNFTINDVKIFQAGNTCKAQWVEDAFKEMFEEDANINMVWHERSGITPKNAVAKGALYLSNVGVYNYTSANTDTMPLDRYIWNEDDVEEIEEAEPIFRQGDNQDLDYKLLARRNNAIFRIYYSSTVAIEDEYDPNLKSHNVRIDDKYLEEDKFDIWVKPYDRYRMKMVFGRGKKLNSSAKEMILDIESGKIESIDMEK